MQVVAAGSSAAYTVAVSALNGVSGGVTFATSGLPAGVTASFGALSNGAAAMTLQTPASAANGVYAFNVTAASGALTHTASAALGIVQGTSSPFSLRVNAGGPGYTDGQGSPWAADNSGVPVYSVSSSVAGTSDPALYRGEHFSPSVNLQLSFPVSNGIYTVTLKFAEIYYTSAGQRRFDIQINGTSSTCSRRPVPPTRPWTRVTP